MRIDNVYGDILSKNPLPAIEPSGRGQPTVRLSGMFNGSDASFHLNADILSRHLMLIGGTGCGKTNTFFHVVSQLKSQMGDNDVMIVFDTKGDYHKKFFNPYKDLVLSTAREYSEQAAIWNIFEEVAVDGDELDTLSENVMEVAYGIFSEAIHKNNSNPFFPKAAKDIFAAMLNCISRKAGANVELKKLYLNNRFLAKQLNALNASLLKEWVRDWPDQQSVMSYVGDGGSDQGLGVFAELQTLVRQIFVGAFAEKGDFSIRKFVRNRGGRTLFIEYDLSRGALLTPIYKLLIDLALKEGLGRKAGEVGNVYVFCDEFKLLPDLLHIENAVNFGRSQGVKVFAGLQSIEQLTEHYGEARGKNIIAGFSSVFSFRANDEHTRRFTVGKYGQNQVIEWYSLEHKERRAGNVVEDWELVRLKPGEAIVGLVGHKPFKFKFDLF